MGSRTQDWPDRSRTLNNTSYLQFPQQQNRNTTVDNRVCNRCGMQGHIRRQCQLQVAYCTFCNATSHTTGACRARTAFVRDNPVSSSRRTSPNGVNTGSTTNEVQQPSTQQNMHHTSQWSVEPTSNRTQGMVEEVRQMEEHVQPSGRSGVLTSAIAPERLVEEGISQVRQTPAQNAEISSYQPQYQDNRTQHPNMQEGQSVDTRK